MHQLKEVDMLFAKMDLLMKRLNEGAGEKKEVMHIHDSCMTCEECGDTGHSGSNCPELQEDVNYLNNNYYYRPQQIKARINNKGLTTQVIILLINHL
jgi:hypothetical protein